MGLKILELLNNTALFTLDGVNIQLSLVIVGESRECVTLKQGLATDGVISTGKTKKSATPRRSDYKIAPYKKPIAIRQGHSVKHHASRVLAVLFALRIHWYWESLFAT